MKTEQEKNENRLKAEREKGEKLVTAERERLCKQMDALRCELDSTRRSAEKSGTQLKAIEGAFFWRISKPNAPTFRFTKEKSIN